MRKWLWIVKEFAYFTSLRRKYFTLYLLFYFILFLRNRGFSIYKVYKFIAFLTKIPLNVLTFVSRLTVVSCQPQHFKQGDGWQKVNSLRIRSQFNQIQQQQYTNTTHFQQIFSLTAENSLCVGLDDDFQHFSRVSTRHIHNITSPLLTTQNSRRLVPPSVESPKSRRTDRKLTSWSPDPRKQARAFFRSSVFYFENDGQHRTRVKNFTVSRIDKTRRLVNRLQPPAKKTNRADALEVSPQFGPFLIPWTHPPHIDYNLHTFGSPPGTSPRV